MICGGSFSPFQKFFERVESNRTETRIAFDRRVHIARDDGLQGGFLPVNGDDYHVLARIHSRRFQRLQSRPEPFRRCARKRR